MASLYDVAAKAGVSKTLVSRVINNQSGVSVKSKDKILAAMQELQYKPNALARSLVLQKTRTVGVALDTLCDTYFFDFINGIEDEVAKTDYNVVFCSGRNHVSSKNRYIDYFTQGRTDGVIIYGSKLDDEGLIEQLASSGFPFVVVENNIPRLSINNILVDNAYGSRLAVEHLSACGCKSIGHITGDSTVKASLERTEGFMAAMENREIPINKSCILTADFTVASGYRAVMVYIEEYGKEALPDGFYCGSDNTAYGAMTALGEAGIRVPEDVMLVGFDNDQPKGGHMGKGLTTLSQPLYKMGSSAVKLLLDGISSSDTQKQRLVYYPELIVRESTRKKGVQ